MQPGQFFKRDAVFGNQLLVGGDYVSARRKRLPDPFARGLETACELDHDVGLGGQNLIEVIGPMNGGGDPRDALTVNAAIKYAAQFQALRRMLTQNTGDRVAYGAKPQNRDFHRVIHIHSPSFLNNTRVKNRGRYLLPPG